jgi:hypothetical protein
MCSPLVSAINLMFSGSRELESMSASTFNSSKRTKDTVFGASRGVGGGRGGRS